MELIHHHNINLRDKHHHNNRHYISITFSIKNITTVILATDQQFTISHNNKTKHFQQILTPMLHDITTSIKAPKIP